ncbi:hypothetical protein J0H33_13070 [bacterium]|nr:hypothetical protein [bacterium]
METPATISEKGRATATTVAVNQLSFATAGFGDDLDDGTMATYWLLLWVDEATLEFRCELSLPSGMSSDHRVTRWIERIIIPTADANGGSRVLGHDMGDPDADPDAVVVEVERRVS